MTPEAFSHQRAQQEAAARAAQTVETITIDDGPCPFLTCLEESPHVHNICPSCGAVRYGNINCAECRLVGGVELNQ